MSGWRGWCGGARNYPASSWLQYLDERGQVRDVSSSDVNDYLHSIAGQSFTAKDFRTWSATSLALHLLCQEGECRSAAAGKRTVAMVVDCVARRLNNTRTVCRNSYIHPGVIAAYLEGVLAAHQRRAARYTRRGTRGLSKPEQAGLRDSPQPVAGRGAPTEATRNRVASQVARRRGWIERRSAMKHQPGAGRRAPGSLLLNLFRRWFCLAAALATGRTFGGAVLPFGSAVRISAIDDCCRSAWAGESHIFSENAEFISIRKR